jgi:excisionase family DNA binding protein
MAGLASAMPLDPPPEEHMLPAEMIAESGLEPRIGRSVSLDHAAQLLGVSRRTIYNRIREGRLQTIRTLGGSQRVLLDSVQDNLTDAMTLRSDKRIN